MISKDSVAHVAGLAKLAFSEDELQQYTAQLDEILREDVAQNDTDVKALLSNVPTKKGTLIQVPSIIDKEDD